MKKIFNAPQMKVIMVSNDIIATSGDGINNKVSGASQLVGGRRDMFDDSYEEF